MPQASQDVISAAARACTTHQDDPDLDALCLQLLGRHNLIPSNSGIYVIPEDKWLPPEAWSCLRYLCDEWDYDWKISSDL